MRHSTDAASPRPKPSPAAARHRRPRPAIDAEAPFAARRPGALARMAWRLATAKLPARWRRRVRKHLAYRFAGPYDVSVDGLDLRIYPAENHCDRTILGRGHLPEEPERRLIAPLFRRGMVFVDVGANIGIYSLFVSASTAGTARIVALEPHPRTFAKLDFNCALNGFGRVSRINAGAGAREEETVLLSDGGGNIGNASLLSAVGGGREKTAIRLRPLTGVLADEDVTQVDLLKIDVEGFEDQALLPFFETAERTLWPHHLLLETVHRRFWQRDLLAVLAGAGYEEVGRTEENVLLRLGSAVQSGHEALKGP